MRTLRSESQITSDWKLGVDSPVVSICCVTYNHERFVEDALEGFLKQETDFPFEILIYDDASTDKTADVVREYERKYPRIIKPIYQEENQFSRGVGVSSTYNFPRARGKYIALCEGDDYWLDAHKLKKQVDVFSLYEDASMVFHHSYVLRGHLIRKKKLQTFFSEVRKVSDKKVILDLGCFYGTATSMFRKDVIDLSVSLFEGAEKLVHS